MKRLFVFICASAVVFGFGACAPASTFQPKAPAATAEAVDEPPLAEAAEIVITNPVIRLSATTSVNDSGLLPYLQPIFEADTGYLLEISSVGTGAAIEKARKGDADCLLVHDKASEEDFINEGFGEERVPFMFNSFVIVGPERDPAGVKGKTTAADAFKAIADARALFITRGDDSGANKAELKIWTALEIDPAGMDWYINVGTGMGSALTIADEKQAYIFSDKATFLAHENSLRVLSNKSEDMKNTYSLIAVTPERWKDSNYKGAVVFIDWMTSDKTLDLIDKFGVDENGEQLFFPIW